MARRRGGQQTAAAATACSCLALALLLALASVVAAADYYDYAYDSYYDEKQPEAKDDLG